VAFAGAWARHLGSAITVIYVVPDNTEAQPGPELLERLSTFSNAAGGPQLLVDRGDPATRISEQARALGSDLIAMAPGLGRRTCSAPGAVSGRDRDSGRGVEGVVGAALPENSLRS
jgi:nucleotide-binding universal stress UspA family protein